MKKTLNLFLISATSILLLPNSSFAENQKAHEEPAAIVLYEYENKVKQHCVEFKEADWKGAKEGHEKRCNNPSSKITCVIQNNSKCSSEDSKLDCKVQNNKASLPFKAVFYTDSKGWPASHFSMDDCTKPKYAELTTSEKDRAGVTKLDNISRDSTIRARQTKRDLYDPKKKLSNFEKCQLEFDNIFNYYVQMRFNFKFNSGSKPDVVMTLKEEPIPNPIELSLDSANMTVSYKYTGKGADVPYEFKISNKDAKTWKVESDPKTPNIVFIQNANCKFRFNKIDPSDLSFAALKN